MKPTHAFIRAKLVLGDIDALGAQKVVDEIASRGGCVVWSSAVLLPGTDADTCQSSNCTTMRRDQVG